MELSQKYKEFQKTPAFQEGIKQFREGKITQSGNVPIFWVKKRITNRDWNSYCSQIPGYCYLDKAESSGVWVGFLVVARIPFGCEKLNELELIKMQEYCKLHNISPKPFNNGKRK